MTEEKKDDWRVVVIGTEGKCRLCGQAIERGDRAWYLSGRGVQCLECPMAEVKEERQ
jgi:hypothetical protein